MRKTLSAAVLMIALIGAGMPVTAAEAEGVRFDDTARVGGRDLQLNGLGVRSVLMFKAYVAALYVPDKSRSAAELLAQKGPRRLSLRLMTDLSAERFVKAFNDGLRDNLDEAQLAAMRDRIERLDATMRAIGGAKKGDRIDIDLADGATRIAFNGTPRGEPIPGEDFYAAILRIFIGDRPADRSLKGGLLGGA